MRHAERDAGGGDTAQLNQTGEQRARCLAQTLELAGISQIYVTEIKRTQQTAAPLSEELHIRPKVVPRQDVDQLVTDLKAAGSAEVLVVAHADTLPTIVTRLGAGALPQTKPGEQDYDRLVIVPMHDGNAQSFTVVRYCPATENPNK